MQNGHGHDDDGGGRRWWPMLAFGLILNRPTDWLVDEIDTLIAARVVGCIMVPPPSQCHQPNAAIESTWPLIVQLPNRSFIRADRDRQR